MSSQDGSRSMRASKRYSVTALYLSMNANQRDMEIDDDLARGMTNVKHGEPEEVLTGNSTKSTTGPQIANIVAIEEELRTGERREILGFADSIARAEPHGIGRGMDCNRVIVEGSKSEHG